MCMFRSRDSYYSSLNESAIMKKEEILIILMKITIGYVRGVNE